MENDHRVGAACLILLGMIVMGLCYYLAPRPGRFTREVSVEEGDTSYVSISIRPPGSNIFENLPKRWTSLMKLIFPLPLRFNIRKRGIAWARMRRRCRP